MSLLIFWNSSCTITWLICCPKRSSLPSKKTSCERAHRYTFGNKTERIIRAENVRGNLQLCHCHLKWFRYRSVIGNWLTSGASSDQTYVGHTKRSTWRLMFFANFMPICPVAKKCNFILPVRKKTPTFFAAILRPFGPMRPNFNTWDLSSIYVCQWNFIRIR